jgi:alkylation response protein AidB-like acyl-CoA dehydrogenase
VLSSVYNKKQLSGPSLGLIWAPLEQASSFMTFDPTPDQQSRAARARKLAAGFGPSILTLDETCVVPASMLQAVAAASLDDAFAGGGVGAVLVIEELAAASAALAIVVGLGRLAGPKPESVATVAWPGLRGAEKVLAGAANATGVAADGVRLVMCAVAVGVGRAAIAHAISVMKEAGVRAGGDERTPHWTLADAATEIDAARLLTLSAAQKLDQETGAAAAIALARSFSAPAAERAVDAAIRVVGPMGYQAGSVLERLSRDARTLTLVLDTVEQSRAKAASILAP